MARGGLYMKSRKALIVISTIAIVAVVAVVVDVVDETVADPVVMPDSLNSILRGSASCSIL